MEEPNARLIGEIDALEFREPKIPVVCNVDGKVHTSASEIRDLLKQQMVSGVLWTATVETLLGLGTQAFVEIGPGKVLSGLVKRIAKEQVVASVGSADEVEALAL
jgi:[acyl-carrier-protein] S-malonyltransferase